MKKNKARQEVKKLKTEESYGVLNEVLDREFKEIT